MDLYEVQETIKKHITVIKKTIIKPLGFDIILKIPKDGAENGEKEVKILEIKISKKNNELSRLSEKLQRTRLTHKGLARKIHSMKKMESNGHQNNGSAHNGINGFGEIKKKYPNLP